MDLLEKALEAHGGRGRWERVRTVRARLDMHGPTWAALGLEKIFAGVDVAVDVAGPRTVFTGFTGPGVQGVWTPDRVAIGEQERRAPRESFPARTTGVRWDPLHALYFGGYAMWNYLTVPYLLTRPGVRTVASGNQLRVTFPDDVVTHCTEQTFTFGDDGLLRRVEYAPDVMGGRPVAHLTEAHRTVAGLVFPTHRYVLPIIDGRPAPEPIIVIDLTDIRVESER